MATKKTAPAKTTTNAATKPTDKASTKSTGKASTKATTKPTDKASTETTEPVAMPDANKKSETKRDRFGNREGTQSAKINTCLGETPKTPSDLAKETGFPVGRISGHMKYLMDRDFVTRSDKGYVVKAKTAKRK